MKVSRRIKALGDLLQAQKYTKVLDTCCDHGLIGLNLLDNSLCSFDELILIDIVPSIIQKLELAIADIPRGDRLISTQIQCVKKIKCSSQDLVIMAGVGADLVYEAILSHKKNEQIPRHYLISAHTKHVWLREKLKEEGLLLVKEELILEDNIFYDHILLSFSEGNELKAFNQTGSKEALKSYYQEMQKLFEIKAKYGEEWFAQKLKELNSIYH